MSTGSFLKSKVRLLAPGIYKFLQHRIGHPASYRRAAKIVEKATGTTVQDGPFRGMKLADAITGSYVPKLVGAYECELHSVVEEIIKYPPSLLIDVGCGEGYYLVGFARQLPDVMCIGFDIDEVAKAACRKQADMNGVSARVKIEGRCDHSILLCLPLDSAVLIVDCEGFEMELLDPQLVPSLQKVRILTELHEPFAPGVTRILQERFAPSHEVRLIDAKPRNPSDYRLLEGLSRTQARMVIDEARYGAMQWAWMTPRASALEYKVDAQPLHAL